MEGERDTEGNMDDPSNVTEEVAQVGTASASAANDVNSGTEEDDETGSSSGSSLNIPTASERALRNPLILQNLFKLCPVSIVASCRLVCKQWYDESLKTWRSAFPLTMSMHKEDIFIVHRDHFYHAGKYVPNTFTPLKEFLEFCEKPESQCSTKPFRNFKIQECQFSLNSEDFELFWNAIGRNLTTLDLNQCKFANPEEFRQIFFKCCPVLQSLRINYSGLPIKNASGGVEVLEYTEPVYGEHKHLKSLSITCGGGRKFPVSWMEILSHFSFLTSFELISFALKVKPTEPVIQTLAKVINEIRKTDKRKLPFKYFLCHPQLAISRDPACQSQLAILKELRVPLRECSIDVHPELDQHFLRDTLGFIAALVDFNLSIYQSDENADQATFPTWFLDFPFGIQMKNLRSLVLHGSLCGSFTFLKYAPNLSRLKIIDDRHRQQGIQPFISTSTTEAISNTCKEELANVKMVQLATFGLFFIVSDEDIQQLFNWMPNIRSLCMVLNDRQLDMVRQNWKNVERLELLGNRLTANEIMYQQEGNKSTGAGSRPDLANLQGLKTLHVLNVELSKKDVFDLFLHLPILDFLAHQKDRVSREDLDLSAYKQAIEDNTVEQWISNLGSGSLRRRWR